MATPQFDMGRTMRGRRGELIETDDQTCKLINQFRREIAECEERGDEAGATAGRTMIDRLLGPRPD